jgi:hypothetical protein
MTRISFYPALVKLPQSYLLKKKTISRIVAKRYAP